MGDPGGSQLTAKTGNDEVNGDRGAHKEPKTKREEAEEEKKGPQEHPKGSTPIDSAPPLGGNVGFTVVEPMFLLIPLGRSKVLLGGSWGGLWGGLGCFLGHWGGIFGGLGGLLGRLGGILGGLGGILGGLRPAWVHFYRFYLNKVGRGGPTGSKKGPNMAPKMGAKTNQNRRQKRS